MDNHTTVECGQLTGNEGVTSRATPKFDEDMLLLRLPRHPKDECPTHKRIIKAHRLQGYNGPRKTQNTGTTASAIAGPDLI